MPPVLVCLIEAELMSVSRGFRQSGLTGGTIAFPQDAARLLTTLPPSPKDVAEHFLVTFAALTEIDRFR